MTVSSFESAQPLVQKEFPDHATAIIGSLSSSLTDMFLGLPGGIRKSYDVNKLLGVDARLSWQIFKLTGPGNPLSLAGHVPLPAAMRRLLTAASKHGIKPDAVIRVREAFDAFEQLVEKHAGDRSIFDSMIRSLGDDETYEQTDILHRKAIFKGHRHYLGTEIDTCIMTVINYPTADPNIVDIGNIRSKIGMRRLRTESEMIVDSAKIWNVGEGDNAFWQNMIDPAAAQKYGAAVMPEFCSSPIPKLKFQDDPTGQRVTTFAGDIVGRQGAADLVFGNVWRNKPLFSPDDSGTMGFNLHLYNNCPTVRIYMDVLVPRAIFHKLDPTLEVYGFAPVLGEISEIKRTQPRLAFREKINRLAGGINGSQIREVPQYVQLLRSFCERLNWKTDEFEIFRLLVEYPIPGSLISLRFCEVASQKSK